MAPDAVAPVGPTHTATGTGDTRIRSTRVANSALLRSTPGESSWMTSTSLSASAALRMARRRKSPTTLSMRPLTSTTSMMAAASSCAPAGPTSGAESSTVARAKTERSSLRMVHGNRSAPEGPSGLADGSQPPGRGKDTR